jgi:hypothetical protein
VQIRPKARSISCSSQHGDLGSGGRARRD